MIQTIAVINMKGGVGKSTTVAALSEIIASNPQQRVLVLDLDPQAHSSLVLAGPQRWREARQAGRTIDKYFDDLLWERNRTAVSEYIVEDVSDVDLKSRMDIMITTPEFRYTERELIEKLVEDGFRLREVRQRIANAVRRIRDQSADKYEFVIVDCPPGISYFAEAALLIADAIVIPTIPDIMSQFGLDAFIRRVLQPLAAPPLLQRPPLPDSRIAVLLSKVDPAMPLHRSEIDSIRHGDGYHCLADPVLQDEQVARAPEFSEVRRTLEQKYGRRALPAFQRAAEYLLAQLSV